MRRKTEMLRPRVFDARRSNTYEAIGVPFLLADLTVDDTVAFVQMDEERGGPKVIGRITFEGLSGEENLFILSAEQIADLEVKVRDATLEEVTKHLGKKDQCFCELTGRNGDDC
jgi:hypothetical protein